MKTRITIFFLLLATFVQAQDNYMSLSFGLSNPLADYANNKLLEDHGYALSGFMADYSAAYYVKNNMGVTGSIKFNQNTVDKAIVTNEMLALLSNEPENESLKVDTKFWNIVSFGIGVQFTLPIGERLNFDVFAMPGLHIVTAPKMDLIAIVDNELNHINISSQNIRFGFESGVGLRFMLNENTGLRVFANYLQTSSKGEIIHEIESETNGNSSTKKTTLKTVKLINAGIGIVYRMQQIK